MTQEEIKKLAEKKFPEWIEKKDSDGIYWVKDKEYKIRQKCFILGYETMQKTMYTESEITNALYDAGYGHIDGAVISQLLINKEKK